MGKTLGTVAAILVAVSLSGCTASYRNHGFVPPEDELENIVVGVDTRDSVAESVGVPATSSVVDDSGFYYVQSRVRHFAYKRPEVVDREIVAISFDSNGVVRNIERFGLEDGQVVPLSRRVTSEGVSLGVLRQILGNIGQFSAADVL